MKRLIILQLCLIFFAASFKGDTPPSGWYIQQIPVNKDITDIYFVDTLNGWAVTNWNQSYDTAYILKTTNGGINWTINFSAHYSFDAIQFLNVNTGYACGGYGSGVLFKTTNGGINWTKIMDAGHRFTDLWFINKDTGWVADNDAVPFGIGLLKTTNGGINWTQQMSNAYMPEQLFFLNKDTGWVLTDGNKLYRTINSGNTWDLLINFNSSYQFNNFLFSSIDTGWISILGSNLNDLQKTTNGGINWQVQSYPYNSTYHTGKIFMLNSKYGYVGFENNIILKTIDGVNWNHQNAPTGSYYNLFFIDSLHGWAARFLNWNFDIAATTDGGGPVMQIANTNEQITKDYTLYQNYPNPFNPTTKISYKVKSYKVTKLSVYDVTGKEVAVLVNEKQKAGEYEVKFDGSNLSSGIYFYSLYADGKITDTKKMILLK